MPNFDGLTGLYREYVYYLIHIEIQFPGLKLPPIYDESILINRQLEKSRIQPGNFLASKIP